MTVVERLYFEVIGHRQRHGCNPALLYLTTGERISPAFARTTLLGQDSRGAYSLFMGIPMVLTD